VAYLEVESRVKSILSGVEVAKVGFEGPNLCIYVKRPLDKAFDLVGEVLRC